MMVLHSEDADRCISMTTEEQAGRTERGEQKKEMTSIDLTCPQKNNDSNMESGSSCRNEKLREHAFSTGGGTKSGVLARGIKFLV